jgi:hypothetical protein
MGDNMKLFIFGFISAFLLFGFQSYAVESDKAKWERINKNKEERRVNERRYESCVKSCLKMC